MEVSYGLWRQGHDEKEKHSEKTKKYKFYLITKVVTFVKKAGTSRKRTSLPLHIPFASPGQVHFSPY